MAFNEAAYLAANKDVADAIAAGTWTGSGQDHYNAYGKAEGRANPALAPASAGIPFDEDAYLRAHPDVKAAIANGTWDGTGQQHYDAYGRAEGRALSSAPTVNPAFNENAYLTAHPDVAAAITNGQFDGTAEDHYNQFGKAEGRSLGNGLTGVPSTDKKYGTNLGQETVDWGLGRAKETIPGVAPAMPDWYGDRMKAPVTQDYGASNPFVQNASPYEKVGGIGQGGYDNLRAQMRGEVDDAYSRALIEGDNRFGGNGLYGSQGTGLQSDYMGQAQKQLQQGYLNADKAGYELQQQDLQNIDAQNQFGWKAGETVAARAQDYGNTKYGIDVANANAPIDFYNNNLAGKFSYDNAARSDIMAQNQQQFTNSMSLATGSMPYSNANLSAQTQQNIANANNRTASNNSLYSGIGGVVGGLLSNNKVTSGVSNYMSGLFGNSTSSGNSSVDSLSDYNTLMGNGSDGSYWGQ